MTSHISALLAQAASSVSEPTPAQRDILAKFDPLQARLEEGVLRVAVLGQFKRGKSTLLNALLGQAVLPMGVTPVTAIPTFIKAGNRTKVEITFKGGKEPLLIADAAAIPGILERHVSETQNPHNRLGVDSVAIEIRSEFLDHGIVLIDTPGVGSTFLHNTQAAEAVLTECDVGVFVLSVDPPITETEANYLRDVQKLIPKLFFALNKIDLLDAHEREVAERFLLGVLGEIGVAEPARILPLSARQGLQAKLAGDCQGVAASGVGDLEHVLADELAREKRGIILTTARQRSLSLLNELLFQSELQHKALLTPEQDLKQRIATFESSVARFESERQALSDFLLVDRKRLLSELDAETDHLWNDARNEITQLLDRRISQIFDPGAIRQEIAAALARYFDQALRDTVGTFRTRLGNRLAVHQDRAGALINLVRRTAADLMEISVTLPQSTEAFELKREPYWVAPEASVSLLDLSAESLNRLLPRGARERRLKYRLTADAERAVLRNVANLDWAVRQNIEEAFRRFESRLTEQMDEALHATREALQLALARKSARAEEFHAHIAAAARCVATLSDIVRKLKSIEIERL